MSDAFRQVIVLEDSAEDFEAIRRGFAQMDEDIPVLHIADGEQGLDYLLARGQYEGAPPPGLVLVDLDLPGLPGQDILELGRDHPALRETLFVVLTGSHDPAHARASRAAGADAFLVKPGPGGDLAHAIAEQRDLWANGTLTP